jgi:hypothetical protein
MPSHVDVLADIELVEGDAAGDAAGVGELPGVAEGLEHAARSPAARTNERRAFMRIDESRVKGTSEG